MKPKPEPEPRGGARTGGDTGKGRIGNGTDEEEEDRLVECSSTLNLRLTKDASDTMLKDSRQEETYMI